MDKKPWQTPTLVVLVHGQPAEAILMACKSSSTGGPNGWESSCRFDRPLPSLPQGCYDCNHHVAS